MAGAGAHHLFMAGAETGLRVVIGVSLSVGPGRTHGECSVPVYRQNLVYLFNPYLPPVRPSTPQAWSGGRTQGRPYSANNRMSPVVCPSRRSRVRAARKPVSPLGNYSFPLFCLPADYPGASTVESVAGAWRRLALHRADDALSKFPARPPLCRTCLFGCALTGLVLTRKIYKK